MQIISIRFKSCFCSEKAKSQHKIKTFLTIGKTPYFYQKNSKNPEKLIVFQGFYSGQHFYPLNMADDYNSPQKCPFSDVETTKNLGYDSRQYLLGILYSILPPLSILSKAFILQWVKGENIHEKKGRPKDAFPLGRPCCFTSV